MAWFSSKTSPDDEKKADTPPPVQDVAAGDYEEGGDDEVKDDLHRGMKPRQLSTSIMPFRLFCASEPHTDKNNPCDRHDGHCWRHRYR
jgi:hypothetical protein